MRHSFSVLDRWPLAGRSPSSFLPLQRNLLTHTAGRRHRGSRIPRPYPLRIVPGTPLPALLPLAARLRQGSPSPRRRRRCRRDGGAPGVCRRRDQERKPQGRARAAGRQGRRALRHRRGLRRGLGALVCAAALELFLDLGFLERLFSFVRGSGERVPKVLPGSFRPHLGAGGRGDLPQRPGRGGLLSAPAGAPQAGQERQPQRKRSRGEGGSAGKRKREAEGAGGGAGKEGRRRRGSGSSSSSSGNDDCSSSSSCSCSGGGSEVDGEQRSGARRREGSNNGKNNDSVDTTAAAAEHRRCCRSFRPSSRVSAAMVVVPCPCKVVGVKTLVSLGKGAM